MAAVLRRSRTQLETLTPAAAAAVSKLAFSSAAILTCSIESFSTILPLYQIAVQKRKGRQTVMHCAVQTPPSSSVGFSAPAPGALRPLPLFAFSSHTNWLTSQPTLAGDARERFVKCIIALIMATAGLVRAAGEPVCLRRGSTRRLGCLFAGAAVFGPARAVSLDRVADSSTNLGLEQAGKWGDIQHGRERG